MKKIIADVHTHTLASGHAYGTMREMAAAAAERGLQIIGFTDHAPGIPGTCSPTYFMNFEVVPRSLSGVGVLFGSEINVQNDGTLSLEQRYLDRLDYGIVGIHGMCYTDAGREGNTANLISCMRNPKVRIVSHPDDDHTPLDYTALVRASVETHTALELNNSSLVKKDRRLNCYENYRTMLGLCRKEGMPIAVDSDAHDPSQVGHFELAEALLDELNFPPELVLNTDRERLLAFLTEKI